MIPQGLVKPMSDKWRPSISAPLRPNRFSASSEQLLYLPDQLFNLSAFQAHQISFSHFLKSGFRHFSFTGFQHLNKICFSSFQFSHFLAFGLFQFSASLLFCFSASQRFGFSASRLFSFSAFQLSASRLFRFSAFQLLSHQTTLARSPRSNSHLSVSNPGHIFSGGNLYP